MYQTSTQNKNFSITNWRPVFVEDAIQALVNQGIDFLKLEAWLFKPGYKIHHLAHVNTGNDHTLTDSPPPLTGITKCEFTRFQDPPSQFHLPSHIPILSKDNFRISIKKIVNSDGVGMVVDIKYTGMGYRDVEDVIFDSFDDPNINLLVLTRTSYPSHSPLQFTQFSALMCTVTQALEYVNTYITNQFPSQLIEVFGESESGRNERVSKAKFNLENQALDLIPALYVMLLDAGIEEISNEITCEQLLDA